MGWFRNFRYENAAGNFVAWGNTDGVRLNGVDLVKATTAAKNYDDLSSQFRRAARGAVPKTSDRDKYVYYQVSVDLPRLKNYQIDRTLIGNTDWVKMANHQLEFVAKYKASDGASSEQKLGTSYHLRAPGTGGCHVPGILNVCNRGSTILFSNERYEDYLYARMYTVLAVKKGGSTDLAKFRSNTRIVVKGWGGSGSGGNAYLTVPIQFGTYVPPRQPAPPVPRCGASITGFISGTGTVSDPFNLGKILIPRSHTSGVYTAPTGFRIDNLSASSTANQMRSSVTGRPSSCSRVVSVFDTRVGTCSRGRGGAWTNMPVSQRTNINTFFSSGSLPINIADSGGWAYFHRSGSRTMHLNFSTILCDIRIVFEVEAEPEPVLPCGGKTCPTGFALNEQTCECESTVECENDERLDTETNTCVPRCTEPKTWDEQTQQCICPTPPMNREFVPGTTVCATRVKCVTPFVRNPATDTCECPAVPDGFERTPGSTNCETRRICDFEWTNSNLNEADHTEIVHVQAGAQTIDGPTAVNCYDEKTLDYSLSSVSPRNAVRITQKSAGRSPTYKLQTNLGLGEVATFTVVATDGSGGRITANYEIRAAGVTCDSGQICIRYSSEQSGVCIACGCPPLREGHEWVQEPDGLPSCRSRPIPTRLRWKGNRVSGSTIKVTADADDTRFTLPEAVSNMAITYRMVRNQHSSFTRRGRTLSFPANYNEGTRRTIQWYASAGNRTIVLNIEFYQPERTQHSINWPGCYQDGGSNQIRLHNMHRMQVRVPLATSTRGPVSHAITRISGYLGGGTVRFVNEAGNPHILIEPVKPLVRRENGDEVYAFETNRQNQMENLYIRFSATDGAQTVHQSYYLINDASDDFGYGDGYIGIAEGYSPGENMFVDTDRQKEYAVPVSGGKIYLLGPVNDAAGDTTGIALTMTSTAPSDLWTGTSLLGSATNRISLLRRAAKTFQGFVFPPQSAVSKPAERQVAPGMVDTRTLAQVNAAYVLDIHGLEPGLYVFNYVATKDNRSITQTLNVRVGPCDTKAPQPKRPPKQVDALTWADDCYNNGQNLTYNISPAFTRINLPLATGGTERITYRVQRHGGFDHTYLAYEHQLVISPVVGTQRFTLVALAGDSFITAELTINIIDEYEDASPDPLQQCDGPGAAGGRVTPNPLGKPSMYIATHFAGIMRDKNVVTRIPGAVISGFGKLVPGKFYGVDRNGDLATIPIDPQTGQSPGLYFLRAVSQYELVIMPTLNGTVLIDPAQLRGRVS